VSSSYTERATFVDPPVASTLRPWPPYRDNEIVTQVSRLRAITREDCFRFCRSNGATVLRPPHVRPHRLRSPSSLSSEPGVDSCAMKIAIGSDHAGFAYKERIRAQLTAQHHEVTDFGAWSTEAVDYPVFIRPVAEAVARGDFARGIVLGGSGNGEAMVANRVRGVRCVLAWNVESARLGRAHNDANVLAIGERLVTEGEALAIVDVWMTSSFDGGRHQRRIELIDGTPTSNGS
jgi:ribose 5-phosphate isomerase B